MKMTDHSLLHLLGEQEERPYYGQRGLFFLNPLKARNRPKRAVIYGNDSFLKEMIKPLLVKMGFKVAFSRKTAHTLELLLQEDISLLVIDSRSRWGNTERMDFLGTLSNLPLERRKKLLLVSISGEEIIPQDFDPKDFLLFISINMNDLLNLFKLISPELVEKKGVFYSLAPRHHDTHH